MQKFIVSENKLTGTLPAGLLSIPTLQLGDLGNNQLTGSLDVLFNSTLSGSSVRTLNIFSVASNLLTGNIPTQFSDFTSILQFTQNNFTGSLPDSFCDDGAVEVDCGKVHCKCCVNCF
jgi:hypothetical protein